MFKYLEKAFKNGQDYKARDAMALAALARLCDLAIQTETDSQAADKLIQRVNALLVALSINQEVEGIDKKHFSVMADAAMKEAHGTYAVPMYMNKKEIIQVIRTISEQSGNKRASAKKVA